MGKKKKKKKAIYKGEKKVFKQQKLEIALALITGIATNLITFALEKYLQSRKNDAK